MILAFLLLILLAAWYYLGYIPGNEKELYQQHFRWLQKTDKNIRDKIEASDSLLSNLLRGYKNSDDKECYKKIISNYSSDTVKFSAIIIDKPRVREKLKGFNTKNLNLQFSISANEDTSQLVITAACLNKNDKVISVSMNYDFIKFLKPVLQPGIFEHYVIFYNGRYIYEDFHSGLGYDRSKEDSLLKTGKWLTGASILDEKVGGVPYKIFLQPVNFFSGNRLIIAALHTQQRFDAEKKQLPANAALLGIIISLGIILLLPWIRLYCLSKYDRLSLGDATESLIVAKLLISLLALFLFKYNQPFRPEESIPGNILTTKISTAFTHEVGSALFYLDKLDSLMKNNKGDYDLNGISLGNTTLGVNCKPAIRNPLLNDSILGVLSNFQFTEVNWMDKEGNVVYNWTTSRSNATHGKYKDRDYFSKALQHNTINAGNGIPSGFTLEPVISRTNNDFKTVICKPSILAGPVNGNDTVKFVVMDWSLKSLDSVIIPAGYSFAIIDSKGDVKYHSNPALNLNENLVEEFADKQELLEALKGRYEENFKTTYYKESFSVKVSPIVGYPYFMVIMENQGIPNSIEIETFTFSWGMILFFLLIVLVDLFIFIRASSRRSLFKKQAFVTSWLWPRNSSRYEYLVAGFGNVIVIIFLICSFHYLNYLCYFFLLLVSVPILTLFFNFIFLVRYTKEGEKIYKSYKKRCIYWTGGYLLLLNIIAFFSLRGLSVYFLIIEMTMLLVLRILLFYSTKIRPGKKDAIHAKRYLHSYLFMVLTRLLVTSGIPVVFFYSSSFNYEQNLVGRNREYDYTNQLKNKYPDPQKLMKAIIDLSADNSMNKSGIYKDSTWIKNVSAGFDTIIQPINSENYNEQERTATMFNTFGSLLESVSGNHNDNFYKSASDDSSYLQNNIFGDVLYANNGNQFLIPLSGVADTFDKHPILPPNIGIPENKRKSAWLLVETGNLVYKFPDLITIRGIAFWVFLLICLAVIYFILYDIVKRVCSLSTDRYSIPENPKKAINKYLESNYSLWLTGVLPDELLKIIVESLRRINLENNKEQQPAILDLNKITISSEKKPVEINVKDTGSGNYQLQLNGSEEKESEWDIERNKVLNGTSEYVIMLNIENRLGDEKITRVKLDCIQELLQKGKKLILISNMFPTHVQEAFIQSVKISDQRNAGGANMINNIFTNFPLIIFPLSTNNYPDNPPKEEGESPSGNHKKQYNSDVQKELWKALNEETAHTDFMKRLRGELEFRDLLSKDITPDKLALKIESLSRNFYFSIWQSLSPDEKFIMYDLAEDGLANINNNFAVNLLVSKGLIKIEEGHPYIFNRSFRNFIVSSIGDSAVQEINNLSRKNRSWSQLQAPILLIVVGIFIFLGVSQEGIFNNLMGVISAVLAGIPILLKLMTMLGVQNGKSLKDVPTANE